MRVREDYLYHKDEFALKLVLDRQKAENCLYLTGDETRAVLTVLESMDNQQLKIE